MNTEPRFLLDEDSICYGCPEYKHVSETDIQIHLGDVDENGGVCDSSQMCINGDLNTFVSNSMKGSTDFIIRQKAHFIRGE